MDTGSLQGEREFQNELLFASKLDFSKIVAVIFFPMIEIIVVCCWCMIRCIWIAIVLGYAEE